MSLPPIPTALPTATIASTANSTSPHAAAAAIPADGGLTLRQALPYAGLAITAFHLAYLMPALCWMMVLFLWTLAMLTRLQTNRAAFFLPVAVGLCCYTPHLAFFYTIFREFAFCLWLVLPFFIGMFVLLGRLARRQFRPALAATLLPLLWLGLEYFRCELWPLRFGWLTPTLAFADHPPAALLYWIGSFGFAALLMAAVTPLTFINWRRRNLFFGYLAAAALLLTVLALDPGHQSNMIRGPGPIQAYDRSSVTPIRLTGVQTETLLDDESLAALETARRAHPDTDLFVLSEYAFTGRVPDTFLAWCRDHRVWLIGGGSELLSRTPRRKYNTAFVVSPDGNIVFRQAKSVPIQFFDDGLPAESQDLWNSPWGSIGMCVCYDLSFTRVLDRFATQGTQLMVVPTMDVIQWGAHQHWLHTRVAPIRAAEYGLPIFRVCSSGISQAVDCNGQVVATAPFPGIGHAMHVNLLPTMPKMHRPLDRYLAPIAITVIPFLILWCGIAELHRRLRRYQNVATGIDSPQSTPK